MPGIAKDLNPIHDIYWNLASLDAGERKEAAVELISKLEECQASFLKENSVDALIKAYASDINATFEQAKPALHEDVRYGINRLIRGLSSSREAARQGFTAALCGLLRLDSLRFLKSKTLFDLCMKHHTVSSGMKNVEVKDALLGRFFFILALHRAKVLTNSEQTPEDVLEVYVTALAEWLGKKSYLYEFATELIIEILDDIPKETLKARLLKLVMDSAMLQDGKSQSELEGYLLPHQLMLVVHYANVSKSGLNWSKYLPNWKGNSVYKPSNCHLLIKSIKETSYTYPRLHSAVSSLLLELAKRDSVSTLTIPRLWSELSSQLMNSTKAHSKLLLFSIFEFLLKVASESDVPKLFTPQFMRMIVNHASKKDNTLTAAARRVLKAMVLAAKQKPQCTFPIIACLTGPEGNQSFDKLTGTKTVQELCSCLTAEGSLMYLCKLILYYRENAERAARENADLGKLDGQCQFALDQILSLCRNNSVPKGKEWFEEVLKLLCEEAYLLNKSEAARSRLVTVLHTIQKAALSAHKGYTLLDALQYVNNLLKDKSDVFSMAPHEDKADLSDPNSATFMELVAWLKFESLEKPEESRQALLDLDTIWKHIAASSNSGSESVKRKRPSFGESDVEPGDVLVDLLVSRLSESSALGRGIVEKVFKCYTNLVTEEGWAVLFAALTSANNGIEDKNSEGEYSSSEDTDHSSVGVSSDASSEDESDNGEEFEGSDDEALDEKLKGLVDSKDVESSETDNDLDDEEMLRLDEGLVKMMQLRRLEKKDRRKEVNEAWHFKVRVLSLVDIYVRQEKSSQIIPQVISTLGHMATQQQLAHPAQRTFHSQVINVIRTSLVNSRFCAPSYYASDLQKRQAYDLLMKDCVEQLVKDLHEKVNASTYEILCALFANLLRLAWSLDEVQILEKVASPKKKSKTEKLEATTFGWRKFCKDMLTDLLQRHFLTGSTRVKPCLFKVLVDKCPQISFDCLFEDVGKAALCKLDIKMTLNGYLEMWRTLGALLRRNPIKSLSIESLEMVSSFGDEVVASFGKNPNLTQSQPAALKKLNFSENRQSMKQLSKFVRPVVERLKGFVSLKAAKV